MLEIQGFLQEPGTDVKYHLGILTQVSLYLNSQGIILSDTLAKNLYQFALV
jgi:hypothetical protein